MRAVGERAWNRAAQNQQIVRYIALRDEDRLGHCKWLPQSGDICICVGLSGDCFHDYVALRQGGDGLWRLAGEFGAYGFGATLGVLGKREFHLAQAGEPIALPQLGDGDDVYWKRLVESFSKALGCLEEIGRKPAGEIALLPGGGEGADGAWEKRARAKAAAVVSAMGGVAASDLKRVKGWDKRLEEELDSAKKQAERVVADTLKAAGADIGQR